MDQIAAGIAVIEAAGIEQKANDDDSRQCGETLGFYEKVAAERQGYEKRKP